MAYSRKSVPRVLATMITTALVSMIYMLALAPAASARVTIVPGTAQGGGTETLAIRLSNEQPDTSTTLLELTFPTDVAIPVVEVAPVDGWVSEITMRPLDEPVTVGDREIDEAVASIVWTGGEVAPRQFEQFLVTAGPLPPDGRLVFAVVQGYDDGTVDQWTDPAVPGWPGAPTIDLVPDAGAAPADQPADGGAGPVDSGAGPAAAASDAVSDAGQTAATDLMPWLLLAGGVLVAAVASGVGYQRLEQRKRAARRRTARAVVENLPTRAGRR